MTDRAFPLTPSRIPYLAFALLGAPLATLPPNAAAAEPVRAHVASRDERAGVPSFLWADPARGGLDARLASATADEAAREHLRSHAPLYRLRPEDIDSLELRDLHDTGRGPIIARFARRIDGVEVWNEAVSVAMNRRHDAIALVGFVTGDAPATRKAGAGRAGGRTFTLPVGRAAAIAITDLAGRAVDESAMEEPLPAEGGYQEMGSRDATSPVRLKKTWFRTADRSLVDAYYVEVDRGTDANGTPRHFAYVVSARNGKILFKNDLTAHDHPVTYRVWADSTPGQLPIPLDGPQGNATTPLPGALPNKYNPPFLPPEALTVSSLRSLGIDDDWLPPGATETLGNNVDAYADIASPDGFTPGADFRADVTAPDTFDRTFDLTQSPASSVDQQKAAITQLFYNVNFWHDWYYAAGFDERSGNAQSSNFGRGGVQGDPVRGEVQDFSAKNNATMSTPADGGRPRMQMYLWDYGVAGITTTAPTAATFDNVGLPSGWSSLNFTIPDTTLVVRAVPNDGCATLVGTYAGTIVLVDRGTCGFSVKAAFAQAAGASGVIIANVATSGNPTVPPGMALTAGQTPPTVPALSLNLADGNTLRTALAAGSVAGGMTRTTELRDSALDNQIMAHEWGHYISNRLVFNANGLGTNMARGLGEGWADTHALLMTVRPGDDLEPSNATWNGVYALSGYAGAGFSRGNPYYYGIRRYPYSTDMTKNPLTFKHIGDGNPLPVGPPQNANAGANSEVHNSGEVWATMLWECYAGLLRDTQGGAPRLTFGEARDRWRDYLVASYKLTPANPTLLEARDALLAAALASDAADYTRFAQAFAKRGAGIYAVAPDRNSSTNMPVVEDFHVGAAIVATAAEVTDDVGPVCNADGVLDDGETGTLTVTFRNIGNVAVGPTAVTVSSATPGISFPNGSTINVPATGQFQSATASLRIAMSGASPAATFDVTIEVPDLGAGAPAPVTFSILGNYDVVANASYTDTVESPATSWQVVNSPATLGATETWQRVTVTPTDHRWSGASAAQAGTSDLVSPAMYVLPQQPLAISFRHRYSFESPAFDGGVIEISGDGGSTWTDVGAAAFYNGTLGTTSSNPIGGRAAYVNQSAGYPAYRTQTLDLGTAYAGRLVKVRFRIASDAGTSSPGWDVDDVQVAGVSAPPFDLLIGQPVGCNNAPLANAGLSRSVGELTASPAFAPVTVTLDGSASFDVDGQPLTFQWVQLGGPPVTLSNSSARLPTFTAPLVPRAASPTTLLFQLTVSDGVVGSAPAFVQINVTNVNRPPLAAAGGAQLVDERTLITLDGSGSSDPDADDTITYLWSQTAGPAVALSSTTAPQPTFTAPDVTANTALTFRLVVNDGLVSSPPSTVTVTVRDVAPGVSLADAAVAEGLSGTTALTFTATLNTAPATAVTVDWTTADGTATAVDGDYQGASGTLTFAVGVTTQSLTVLVNGDPKFETSETLVVSLGNPAGGVITDGEGVGTIVNDDGVPVISIDSPSVSEGDSGTTSLTYTASLSNPSYQTVSVGWATDNGTATAGPDYTAASGTLTFAPGSAAQTVNVTVTGDLSFEPSETVLVNLSSPVNGTIGTGTGTGTITNDDTLLEVPGAPTIGAAAAGDATVQVTFTPPGSNGGSPITGYTATCSGTGGPYVGTNAGSPISVAVPNGRAVTCTVHATNAIGDSAESSASNRVMPSRVSISVNASFVAEGTSGTRAANLSITRTGGAGAVTFNWTIAGGGAADGTATLGDADYVPGSGAFVFPAGGANTRSFALPGVIVGDTRLESNETFTVTISRPDGGPIGTGSNLVTIQNDDGPRPR